MGLKLCMLEKHKSVGHVRFLPWGKEEVGV